MDRYNWDDVTEEQPDPLITRKVIQMPGLRILRVQFKKGAVVPVHQHSDEQLTIVTSGALLVEWNGRSMVLGSGDVLRVHSDLPHSAEALQDSTSTEVFIAVTT
jgi:quercetin dioxygenase-like cupin family protein